MKIKRWMFAEVMMIVAVLAVLCLSRAYAETKYNGTIGGAADTSAEVTFGPSVSGPLTVSSIFATTDKALGTVKIYARTGNKITLGYDATNSAASSTNVVCANTGGAMTNGDTVVWVHTSGALDVLTVGSTTSTTNIMFTTGISAAGVRGDTLYELAQVFAFPVGTSTTGDTSDVWSETGEIYVSPGDSPVRIVLDGTSNTVINATVSR